MGANSEILFSSIFTRGRLPGIVFLPLCERSLFACFKYKSQVSSLLRVWLARQLQLSRDKNIFGSFNFLIFLFPNKSLVRSLLLASNKSPVRSLLARQLQLSRDKNIFRSFNFLIFLFPNKSLVRSLLLASNKSQYVAS